MNVCLIHVIHLLHVRTSLEISPVLVLIILKVMDLIALWCVKMDTNYLEKMDHNAVSSKTNVDLFITKKNNIYIYIYIYIWL